MSFVKGPHIFAGTVVDTLPDWSLRIRTNCLLIVDCNGTIVAIDDATDENIIAAKQK
jgi:hypothetical protein